MDTGQQARIQSWAEEVTQKLQLTPPGADLLAGDLKPPSTFKERSKRKCAELNNTDLVPENEPRKRLKDHSEATSISPFRDDITLTPSTAPSTSATSRSERSRSSSPNRVKAELARATPKIVFVHESNDPESLAAKELLTTLTEDADHTEREEVTTKISAASCQCMTELRSEGSWINKVAMPLLEEAIGDLPLECWSIQSESVDVKYQPLYTTRDVYNRKIDLVVGLPLDKWDSEYERAGLTGPGKCCSRVSHPHTGKRILGPGVEVKAADGNLVEAQVQLGVWSAGLLLWAAEQRQPGNPLPPIVGCTAVGEDWKFYIIFGIGPTPALQEIRVWGPLADLGGCTTTSKRTASLLQTLRRVMLYTNERYSEQLIQAITSRA